MNNFNPTDYYVVRADETALQLSAKDRGKINTLETGHGFIIGDRITFSQATPEQILFWKRKLMCRAKNKAARKARRIERINRK